MKHLHLTSIPFRESDRLNWIAGRYRMLKSSKTSSFIKNILVEKAKKRPGTRFFGEAYVVAHMEHQEGWYGSFKWLTSPAWVTGHGIPYGHRAEFGEALRTYFPTLRDVQQRARHFAEMMNCKPVPPDLWLIVNGEHRFIEVKLPGDLVSQGQLVGLALIARFLSGDRPVSVWVMHLHLDLARLLIAQDLVRRFNELYFAARAA